MKSRVAAEGLTIVLVVLSWVPLAAQDVGPQWPSAPRERGVISEGRAVSPFFEGWYENPDGTFTLSFGYFNRNTEEAVNLPVGPDNFIAPTDYDGVQPTLFTPGRETGVFTVTVPGNFARNGGRVVWTLRSRARSPHSVPGKVGVEAYRLHYGPTAMGSFPPMLKLHRDGPELWGPMTIAGDARLVSARSGSEVWRPAGSVGNPLALAASVGTPVALTVWVTDRLDPDAERDPLRGGARWYTHQGPALALFSEERPEPDEEAGNRATTTVTFSEPGEYVLRVRADNFNPNDSMPARQCCWTNGYVRVTVSR